MQKLRLAVLALLKENVLRWFFFIELTALFTLVYILTGTISNSTMLCRPFDSLLLRDGYILMDSVPLMAEDPNAYMEKQRGVLSKCTGLKEVGVWVNDSGAFPMLIGYPKEYIHLKLPLSRGRWARYSGEAVVSYNSGYRIGETINGSGIGIECRVVGILTAETYRLDFASYERDMTAATFYSPYFGQAVSGSNGDKQRPFAYIPFSDEDISSAKENGWFLSGSPLYVYKEWTDSAEIESDRKLLKEVFDFIELGEIRSNTERYNENTLSRYGQIFILSSAMVLIGFLSGILLRLDRQRHDMEVYRLCGGSKRQCMEISIGQDLVLQTVSAAVAMIIFRILPVFLPAMTFLHTLWDYIVPSVMILIFIILDFIAVNLFLKKRSDS